MKPKAFEVAYRHSRFNRVMETIVQLTPVEVQKQPAKKPEDKQKSAQCTQEQTYD